MIPTTRNVQPYSVLLIEEDSQQTEIFADLIREVAQCKLDVMSSVESSPDWIARSNYHLVVIDITPARHTGPAVTSGVNPLALLEQIKRVSPVTSVILLNERATVEQAVAAIRLGAEDYLKKPFNLESFQLAVKRGLDRKTVFGENAGLAHVLNLLNSCQMISASLQEGKILEIVESYLMRELGSPFAAVYRMVDGNPRRVEAPGREHGRDRAMEEILEIALHASTPIPALAEAGHDEFYRFVDRSQLTPGLFVFKVHCADPAPYFCVCLSPQRPPAMDAFESRLRLLKAQIEVTGRNIAQYQGVQNLVYVDDATGLYNTRYLNYILDREILAYQASQKGFAVLFVDADKFKSINDTHGHLVGTKLLNELGHLLKGLVRDTDTVFRYGGDEFVAVLSACDLPTASVVAERIRAAVEKRSFLQDEGLALHFTVSIGVALFPEHADSKRAVIDAADQAMYHNKKTTRNNVTIAKKAAVEASAGVPGGKGEAGGT